MKRTIEMDDDLSERVDDVNGEVLENLHDYLLENLDIDDYDQYYQAQGCDCVHECADSSTPIYYSNIDELYYLHGNELDEAYENAGLGDGKEDNYKQVAIYCYLSQMAFEYLSELEKLVEDFIEWRDEEERTEEDKKKYIEEMFTKAN